MTSVRKDESQKKPASGEIQLDDDEDEDAPLERTNRLFGGSRGSYQPVKADSDNQRLIATDHRSNSNQDDDGL